MVHLPGILPEPGEIHGDVGQGPPGIEAEILVFPARGRAVEVRVIRHQARYGMRGKVEKLAALHGRLRPEGVVFGRPQCPEFVEGGQVIGGIGEGGIASARYEHHLFGGGVEHVGGNAVAFGGFGAHRMQNRIGLGAVVEDPLAVAPALGGEEQRRDKPLLAVGGRVGRQLFPVAVAVPGEIPPVGPVALVHEGPGPFPQPVELLLPVQLDGDHHPVGHALRADVVIPDVQHVGQVVPDRVVDAFGGIVAVKELPPGGIQLGLDLHPGFPEIFLEQVPVAAGGEGLHAGGGREGREGDGRAGRGRCNGRGRRLRSLRWRNRAAPGSARGKEKGDNDQEEGGAHMHGHGLRHSRTNPSPRRRSCRPRSAVRRKYRK